MKPHAQWMIAALGVGAAAAMVADGAIAQAAPQTLNVHTTREKDLIAPLLQLFEGLTRVKLNIVYLTGDSAARLKADAANGKVDIFIATELSQLIAAKNAGITEPVGNADLADRVPAIDRDADGHWFGLTRRGRVIATARGRVKQTAFTYEELADPKWKGKVCTRSGLHPYNVLLTASMIEHKGAEATEAWLRGLKANLAGKPSGGDRDQIAAVQAGRCDVALVNTYYIGGLRASKDPALQATGNAVDIAFPNAGDRGAHVSLSGMALIKDAPGLNNAALLMDFLTSQPAQYVYAQENHEYPIRADVEPSGLVASFGKAKLDDISLADVTKHQAKAVELIGKVRFDDGPGS